jgi:hypothetical protein
VILPINFRSVHARMHGRARIAVMNAVKFCNPDRNLTSTVNNTEVVRGGSYVPACVTKIPRQLLMPTKNIYSYSTYSECMDYFRVCMHGLLSLTAVGRTPALLLKSKITKRDRYSPGTVLCIQN